MCTYIKNFRMTLLTAILSNFVQSPKTARNEQVCAHQKSFQNNFGAIMHLSDIVVAPIFQFFDAALDGATANRQIPDRIFGQFFTSLRKDCVANYASIWTLFYLLLEDLV